MVKLYKVTWSFKLNNHNTFYHTLKTVFNTTSLEKNSLILTLPTLSFIKSLYGYSVIIYSD